jgi:aryl-alcohol dehydrogenase-like predicted oxidoreductase
MSGRLGEALAACREAEQRAARTPNQLSLAFARLAEWRLAADPGAVLPAELKARVASLRNPELDLAVAYAGAMRARRTHAANSRRLFEVLASAAANRGYVTLSRRALALGEAP